MTTYAKCMRAHASGVMKYACEKDYAPTHENMHENIHENIPEKSCKNLHEKMQENMWKTQAKSYMKIPRTKACIDLASTLGGPKYTMHRSNTLIAHQSVSPGTLYQEQRAGVHRRVIPWVQRICHPNRGHAKAMTHGSVCKARATHVSEYMRSKQKCAPHAKSNSTRRDACKTLMLCTTCATRVACTKGITHASCLDVTCSTMQVLQCKTWDW